MKENCVTFVITRKYELLFLNNKNKNNNDNNNKNHDNNTRSLKV